jgi:hypothetical protein
MAKIQIYEGQVSPQAPEIVPVDMGMMTAGGKMMSEVGTQLNDIASKFNELDILRKKTRASNDFSIEIDQISNQASQDPNLDNLPLYEQKINEAIEKHSSNVPNGIHRQQTAEAFRINGYNNFSNIRNDFRRRQIQEQRDNTVLSLATMEEEYRNTNDVEVKAEIMLRGNALIDDNVRTGIMTLGDGMKVKIATIEKWRLSEAENDAYENPELFLENGNDYYKLSDKEFSGQKKIAEDVIERRKKEDEKIYRDNQIQEEFQSIVDLTENKIISPSQVREKWINGDWSDKHAQAYIKATTNPKAVDTEEKVLHSGFTDLAKGIYEFENKESTQSKLTDILEAKGKGSLSDEEMAVLIKLAKEKGDSKKDNFIMATLKGMGNNTKMAFNFLKGIVSKKEPQQAKNDAEFSYAISTNPYLTNISDKGTIYIDPVTGMKRKYFKDGTYEDVQ